MNTAKWTQENAARAPLARLRSLLSHENGRFDRYQEFPSFALERVPMLSQLGYGQQQLGLDAPRYRWLLDQFQSTGFTVTDIGGNIGFFSLSLAAERNARAIIYEPVSEYCEVCELLAQACDIDNHVQTIARGVPIAAVDEIEDTDLVMHLNVLHHAGSVFDRGELADAGSWRTYAINYLGQLAKRSRFLFFQTGNVSDGDAHFLGENSFSAVGSVLEEAGWKVLAVGIIEDFQTLEYMTYLPNELTHAPIITCSRNAQTGLVDYTREGRVVAQLPKGSAQRPLWFCQEMLRSSEY